MHIARYILVISMLHEILKKFLAKKKKIEEDRMEKLELNLLAIHVHVRLNFEIINVWVCEICIWVYIAKYILVLSWIFYTEKFVSKLWFFFRGCLVQEFDIGIDLRRVFKLFFTCVKHFFFNERKPPSYVTFFFLSWLTWRGDTWVWYILATIKQIQYLRPSQNDILIIASHMCIRKFSNLV